MADDITWIIIADGREASAFEERVRHGPLHALPDWDLRAPDGGRPSHRHRATVHSRRGSGRHGAGERDLGDAEEARFLTELAERLEAAARDGRFHHLVLMAAPRALGVLRGALGPHAGPRIERADPHDRTSLGEDDLRVALHNLRVPA